MLAYFPKAYPDELLYSVIARFNIHLGIQSPKHLLDLLYQKRTVIAVPDLPAQLQLLCSALQHLHKVDAKELLYQQTLFPLYAPFIPEARKKHLIELLTSGDGSAVYVEIGMSAGKVKMPSFFRYCPECLKGMQQKYGEFAWLRRWLVSGYQVCHVHNCEVCHSLLPVRPLQRHEYIAASPETCLDFIARPNANPKLQLLSMKLCELLSLPECISPTYHQWTMFYRRLAVEAGISLGNCLMLELLYRQFSQYWPLSFLQQLHLEVDGESSWLLALFRKHRKSFSYLQHILVWQVFRPAVSIRQILFEVQSYPTAKAVPKLVNASNVIESDDRKQWLTLLDAGHSAKQARMQCDKALYARLYRRDRDWLLATNKQFHIKQDNHSNINWRSRDIQYLRLLYLQLAHRDLDLSSPRQSRNWLLKQLPRSSTIEKHLDLLPRCQEFLRRYSENVDEYQIRRITAQIVINKQRHQMQRRWELERSCGLANGRTRPLALAVLNDVATRTDLN